VAAANDDEFAWELARLIAALPDPHVSFIPSMDTVMDRWSVPEVKTRKVGRRPYVIAWGEGTEPVPPAAFADDPHAYPEIVAVQGEPLAGTAEILAGGPGGTTLTIRLRWPDGSETDHELLRPDEPNLPPPKKHYGEDWLVTGRVGDLGYMRVRTFDPKLATLGPDGKMTTMLRAALRELKDTDALILDLQGNGGGLVAASDPFLGNLVERSLSYAWGNADGKRRVIRPRSPRYRGDVVALVDGRSASGGEWAARILRDAGRAVVIGGRTSGAEAAVHKSEGPDGSVVAYSAWPMVEPGRTPFQETGIELDHLIPLTIEDVRTHGLDEAVARVRRARLAKALEVLGATPEDLDALVALVDEADVEPGQVVTQTR
jgi:C-terminal processing protease CtpA/Prc